MPHNKPSLRQQAILDGEHAECDDKSRHSSFMGVHAQ